MKTTIVQLEDGETGIVLSDEILAKLDLREGDTLIAEVRAGRITLRLPRPDEIDSE